MQKIKEVLLIEDNEIDIFVNLRLLNILNSGSQLSVCNNGKEALEKVIHDKQAYNKQPDLILLDLQLPIMNGYDFITKLHELEFFNPSETLIIILTAGLIDQSDMNNLKAYGISDILSKPLDIAELEKITAPLIQEREDIFS